MGEFERETESTALKELIAEKIERIRLQRLRSRKKSTGHFDQAVTDIEKDDDPHRPPVGGRDMAHVSRQFLIVAVLAKPVAQAAELVAKARHRALHHRERRGRLVHLERHNLRGDGDLYIADAGDLARRLLDLGRA